MKRLLFEKGINNIVFIQEIIEQSTLDSWDGHFPAPDDYKHMIVRKYSKEYGINNLIETGTYLGGMIYSQLPFFESISSVELSDELYKKACIEFERYPQVHLYHGDSGNLLSRMIDEIDNKESGITFWLDGHYSGEGTARGSINTPVVDEIKQIYNSRVSKTCILIDDARCFGDNGYPTINEIEELAYKLWNNAKVQVYDDIIRITT